MRKRLIGVMAMVSLLWFTTPAHATLWDRGGGLIYDDHLNITWLQDANYAMTSGYDADGRMNWTGATTWAANLVYGGYSGWRLPTNVGGPYVLGYDGTTNAGFNITSSEMGYMYYTNLANKGYYSTSGPPGPQPGWSSIPNATFTDGNGNNVSFINLQSDDIYWSDTGYSSGVPVYEICSGFFYFSTGQQDQAVMVNHHYAWAVRDGDIPPVPIPSTMLLLGSGLAGLVGIGRRRTKK